jgi:hypothetical protein
MVVPEETLLLPILLHGEKKVPRGLGNNGCFMRLVAWLSTRFRRRRKRCLSAWMSQTKSGTPLATAYLANSVVMGMRFPGDSSISCT